MTNECSTRFFKRDAKNSERLSVYGRTMKLLAGFLASSCNAFSCAAVAAAMTWRLVRMSSGSTTETLVGGGCSGENCI